MKWTPIDKAKPKFGQRYLVATKDNVVLAELKATIQTEDGIKHDFGLGVELTATHIAIVDNPNKPSY